MDIPALEMIGKALVTLIVLLVVWQILKLVLKSTFRLAKIGCLVAIGLVGVVWGLGWLG